jgi:hypothetical protein
LLSPPRVRSRPMPIEIRIQPPIITLSLRICF